MRIVIFTYYYFPNLYYFYKPRVLYIENFQTKHHHHPRLLKCNFCRLTLSLAQYDGRRRPPIRVVVFMGRRIRPCLGGFFFFTNRTLHFQHNLKKAAIYVFLLNPLLTNYQIGWYPLIFTKLSFRKLKWLILELKR